MERARALTLVVATLVATAALATSATTSAAPPSTIVTMVGDGSQASGGDGGPATAAKLALPAGVALTAGGYLIADSGNARIREVAGAGVIRTMAGTGTSGFGGDGGPATAAQLSSPSAIAVLANRLIVVADTGNDRIRELSPTGVITTVAGGGAPRADLGDGLPATAATLSAPGGVAATRDGGFLIADSGDARIRLVAPDGVITTVAGSGQGGFAGDGGPATAAQLSAPGGVALLADGGFLIADSGNGRIRKVSAEGTITTVAGTGTAGFSGDGGSALAAQLNHPLGVAPAPGGGFYIADTLNGRVRLVDAAGTITTVAGGGQRVGDRGLPTSARLVAPTAVLPSAHGFLVADREGGRIRFVSSVAVELTATIDVPSRCVRRAFTADVRTGSTYLVVSLSVRLDGRRVASRQNSALRVRIATASLAKGRHVLRADALDATGLTVSVTRGFRRCRS